MHYRLSDENLEEEKCLKVNICFLFSFKPNQVIPFWKGEKVPIFYHRYFWCEKCDFFWSFWLKNRKSSSHNIETFHKEKSGVFWKKPRKQNFMAAALHRELWYLKKQIFSPIFQAIISNILKYFLSETIQAQENGSRGTNFAKFLRGCS